MSSIIIQGNVSGSGTLTIESPNTNSDFTLSLPAETGTLITSANVPGFPSGTVMLFAQTAAPTGWTKDTTNYNNSGLRVVTGTVGTGGTVDFTTAFASQTPTGTVSVSGSVGNTTLTTTQIPSHAHTWTGRGGTSAPYTHSLGALANTTTATLTSDSTGGGGAHSHPLTISSATFSGSAIDLAVKYVDVIRATKD